MLTETDAYLFGAVLLIIVEVILIIKKTPIIRNLIIALFVVYYTLIASLTLFPIPFQEMGYDYAYNFIPFSSIASSFQESFNLALRAVGGNIIMFIPMGILLSCMCKKKNFSYILLLSVVSAIGIELINSFLV